MSNLRRIPYTKPLPPNAQIITRKGQRLARWQDKRGQTREAPLTKDGSHIKLLTRNWYGYVLGDPRPIPLCTNKTAAEQMLAEKIRTIELARVGIVNPYEEHQKRPLTEHLSEWEAVLLNGGATAKHVRQTVNCVRRLLDGCGFVFLTDLSASRVQKYLADLHRTKHSLPPLDPGKESYTKAELTALLKVSAAALPELVRRHRLPAVGNGKARRYPRETARRLHTLRVRGRSIKTSNLYLDAIKQFAAWLVQDRRTGENPLAHLSGANVKQDRRHDRRALPLDELRRVFAAARRSERPFGELSGSDRAVLYSAACASGFRAEELASLHPSAFDLDGKPPTVTLAAEDAKNGQTAVQPLPPDVASALRGYLAGHPEGQPVWPGRWYKKAAEMLRIDLEATGIPYVIEGANGPLYADFHALRHSFIKLLDESGATLKEAMQLARHTDPKLTMVVYGRAQLNDLGEAVRRLPALLSDDEGERTALSATGTEGASPESLRSACASSDLPCDSVRRIETREVVEAEAADNEKPLVLQGVESDCDSLIPIDSSSPSRTRTYNKPVNRRVVYLAFTG
jgi:integrase